LIATIKNLEMKRLRAFSLRQQLGFNLIVFLGFLSQIIVGRTLTQQPKITDYCKRSAAILQIVKQKMQQQQHNLNRKIV
jgi:hypothetical protein